MLLGSACGRTRRKSQLAGGDHGGDPVTLVCRSPAGPRALIGERIEGMITRILGVILAALAAQFVVDGLKQSFPVLG